MSITDQVDVDYREMQLGDVPRLRRLLKMFARATDLQAQFGTSVDFNHFVETVQQLMAKGIGGGVVALDEGQVIGVIAYTLSPNLFTADLTAAELIWYVDPRFRNTVGIRLFKEFEHTVRERGAKHLTMVHLENSMPDKLKNYYERQGYALVETHYTKAV